MSIDLDTVKKLATLSRLEISEDEANKLVGELGSILDYVGKINSALTDETISVDYPLLNIMREDNMVNESGLYTDDLIALAPDSERGFVKVKKII